MKGRRWWAIATLLLMLTAVVTAVVNSVTHFPKGLSILACLVAAASAGWFGRRHRHTIRVLAFATAWLLLAGALVLLIVDHRVPEDLLVLACGFGSLATAREAFRPRTEHPPATRPSSPVVFYNPRSGGGKAERFHIVDEARRRGIEPIELTPGADLDHLVRAAVARGADALAMAGGDGSQAIVAAIASELDLPYACIPAGTRNHFALDLGVDRDDVVGALDALVEGGERRVDLAAVNGRVFVNNVSLGLYAHAVQQPGYREAKLHTLLATVPRTLGPDAAAPSFRWEGPEGPASAAAILISNNAYRLGRALGSGTRPRLDRGELGITVLAPLIHDGDGNARHRLTMQQWTADRFEIAAEGEVPAAIDGEAVMLEGPLRFTVRPGALRVRIAPQHPGASPSALEPPTALGTLEALAGFAVHGEPASVT